MKKSSCMPVESPKINDMIWLRFFKNPQILSLLLVNGENVIGFDFSSEPRLESGEKIVTIMKGILFFKMNCNSFWVTKMLNPLPNLCFEYIEEHNYRVFSVPNSQQKLPFSRILTWHEKKLALVLCCTCFVLTNCQKLCSSPSLALHHSKAYCCYHL